MKRYSLFFILVLMLASCQPETKDNTLSIKFNINAGSSPLAYNTNYTVAGYTVQYTLFKFYMSQPVLSSGADMLHNNDSYFLGDASLSNNTWVIGDIGKRTIDGIAFGFGVDSSRNSINGSRAIPAYAYPTDHPLSASNNMYWGWNPGYIWMKLEGRVDANSDGDFNDVNEQFSFHTGVDPSYRLVSRTFIFSMNDAPKTIQIDMDVHKFLESHDFISYPFAHPSDTTSIDYHTMMAIQENSNLVFGNFYE
jgi:hypothetical protein